MEMQKTDNELTSFNDGSQNSENNHSKKQKQNQEQQQLIKKQIDESSDQNMCIILGLMCLCFPVIFFLLDQYMNFKELQNFPQYLSQIPNINEILEQRLNEFQAKCSHNSYYFGYYYQQVQYNPNYPFQGGCSMLEFDISLNPEFIDTPEIYTLYINHDILEDKSQLFQHGLESLALYHQDFPLHLPLFITINIKGYLKEYQISFETLIQKIENQIQEIIDPEDIYTPKDILKNGTYKTIDDAVKNENYPKISELLGKFFIILDPELFDQQDNSQNELLEVYQKYVNNVENNLSWTTLDGRLLVINYMGLQEFIQKFNIQNQIFFNMPGDLYQKDYYYLQEEAQNLLKEAGNSNFITRVYTINDEQYYNFYRDMGINFICTDAVFYNTFAKPFY